MSKYMIGIAPGTERKNVQRLFLLHAEIKETEPLFCTNSEKGYGQSQGGAIENEFLM